MLCSAGVRGRKRDFIPHAAKTILACHGNLHLHPANMRKVNNSITYLIFIKAFCTSLKSFLTAIVSPFLIASLNPCKIQISGDEAELENPLTDTKEILR